MLSQFHLKKTKRGVSIMIGYILLISFVIVISIFVYQWLKTYVPKQGLECPDGISVYISEIKSDSNTLTLTLKNTGRFNIDGVFVYYSDDEDKQTVTENLGNYLLSGGAFLGVDISFGGNTLKPGLEQELIFSNINNLNIKFIEIIPAKNQKVKNKIVPVTCGEGKVKKVVSNCVDGDGDGCDACDVTNNGVPIPGCFCNILNTNTPHPNCECDEDDSDDGFQCQNIQVLEHHY